MVLFRGICSAKLYLCAALLAAACLPPAPAPARTPGATPADTGATGAQDQAAPDEADPDAAGAGLQDGRKDGGTKGSSPSRKEDDKSSFEPQFAPCNMQDVGSDSLWKFPSESWKDGAAFIPPQNACKTAEILDSKGQKTGRFRLLRNHISGIYMCEDKGCRKYLNFELVGYGEYCVWRVRKGTWSRFFGGKPFGVVMILQDGRYIRWDLKDPYARNGMPPYPDLKHRVSPYCYVPLR